MPTRNDWSRHKQECSTLAAAGEVPTRNMGSIMRSTAQEGYADPDTIYYLKTSKPHLQDISVSGPFYPLETVLTQLLLRLRKEKSSAGEEMLDEFVYNVGFATMEHLNAPLPDGNIMELQLLREKNPDVARSLPGKVWYVAVATPIIRGDLSSEHPRIQEMDVRGTFKIKEEANRAAEQVLEQLGANAGRRARVQKTKENGLVAGMVINPVTNVHRLVQVKYDDGSIQETDSSGNPL